ncbi:universal stress protein [Streptomyces sp. NPDC051665]|uniref:universal stress protein n=1 Tax=Streptomyces sp. NPDC051665 TaxID=3154647 RepID=UPI00343617C7
MPQLIVVGVDGSTDSRIAADWAATEAELRGLRLRVVHVSTLPDEQLLTTWPYFREPSPDALVAALAKDHPELRAEVIALTGEVVPALLPLTAEADCTVLGLRGTGGFTGLALGSVAHGVAERSAGPVVLVPSGFVHSRRARSPYGVTLGVDGGELPGTVADFAFDAACRRDTGLHVVHAWRLPSPAEHWMPYAPPEKDRGRWEDQETQRLSDALRPWREKYPHVGVYEDLRLQSPAAALVQASAPASAELLVIGRAGTTLGPTPHAVLEHTACPVAVVPHRT